MGHKNLLGGNRRKLQPKLRMIANGDLDVNVTRANSCPALRVTRKRALREEPPESAVAVRRAAARKPRKVKTQKTLPSGVSVNVFVHLADGEDSTNRAFKRFARRGNLLRGEIAVDELPSFAENDAVAFVEIGERVVAPLPTASKRKREGPSPKARRIGREAQHGFGEDVLIGIIDVGGFDFAHPDFLDAAGRTRFVRIWDQAGTQRPSPARSQFAYGAEFTKAQLDAAIAAAPRVGVPAHELERQSQIVPGSHGTHVASIAAGNHGVCRRAPIAAVLLSLPKQDQERRAAFYDTTRLADAVDYLVDVAEELGKKRRKPPLVSINISLGTNGHAHDGSGAVGRWIDHALTVPGRCVSVAAGNAGQERAESADDLGWVMGRIHTSGQIPARDLERDLEWIVVGNGIADVSENELELWYGPQDRFAVSLRPPGGSWIGPIEPQHFVENQQLADKTFISIYNELYHPANGSNYISIYLSPFLSRRRTIGVSPGTWTVRLRGREVRDGSFHGWIERDDPRPFGRVGDREAWSFPSFCSEASFVDDTTVSALACGHNVISVGNLDPLRERIHITSSQGPTRDGRLKPDIAAPGTEIVAAKGFAGSGDLWTTMSGTSMASPYVAGVAGLMLAIAPKLTAAQIQGIMLRTSKPLPGASFAWKNDMGFGAIDAQSCLAEAALIDERTDMTV